MLDLLAAIERRMSYLERALPVPLPQTKKDNAELASQLHFLLPVLASRCANPPGEDSDEIVCVPSSGPLRRQSSDGTSAPTEREKLLRLLQLLEKTNNRRLVALGKPNFLKEPLVFVFIGRKVYVQDSSGRRELRVDGDRVVTKFEGCKIRYWIDGVEVSRTGVAIARRV